MSLKWKLSLFTSALLLAAVAAFSTVLLWSERRSLEEASVQRRQEAVAGLAEVCRSAAVNQQDLPLTNYLRRLAASDEIKEAYCLDPTGRVFGHTDPARLNAILPSGGPPDPAVFPVETAVTVGHRELGSARILYDRKIVDRRLEVSLQEARRRIGRTAAAVGAMGFALAFLATAWAVRPVRALVQGARAIGAGRLDQKILLRRHDELGRLADEFNLMAEKLAELDRMKADFVNGITHDLKSPLTAVKASTDNLQAFIERPGDPGAAYESLTLIHRNADRLLDLISSILEVAKIEHGTALVKTPVDLESLADRVARNFRPLAAAKGLSLEMVAESPVPPFPADEGKLERALSNLVGNAVKFTQKGGVTISVGSDGGRAVVSVRDTGPGIPADLRGRLFTKFSRAQAARGTEGAGLGLAIVKGFVEAHGGSVDAQDAPGGGTIFTFQVPLT
jgi:signal transduction histidine kinase